jgi:hypothetical protein
MHPGRAATPLAADKTLPLSLQDYKYGNHLIGNSIYFADYSPYIGRQNHSKILVQNSI